jgi:hypothetical protein
MKKILIPTMCALVLAMSCGKKSEAPAGNPNPKVSGSNPKVNESSAKEFSFELSKAAQLVHYSFKKEAIVTDRREADLNLYFDGDDCAKGAIFGNDDRKGYLFPVGQKTLSELSLKDVPTDESKTETGIQPITKDKEGLAFWVKTKSANGRFALVRIKSVQPAAYSDFDSGAKAKVELEWAWQSSK